MSRAVGLQGRFTSTALPPRKCMIICAACFGFCPTPCAVLHLILRELSSGFQTALSVPLISRSGCKVKKFESQSLDFDACSQDEGAVISKISDIPNRDGHATDEEKLASTSCGQKLAGAELKGEPGEDRTEY